MNKLHVSKTDYSQIAKFYDKIRPIPSQILVSKIIEYGKIDANCTVLDVGCGTGRFPLNMPAIKDLMLCALEPSGDMLKQAVIKNKSKRLLWLRGDGQQLPFQNNVFDCVYMTAVIHHIENREVALRETYRTLKEGGNCVIMTFSHSGIKKHVTRDFPRVVALDLKRVPSVPSLKRMMIMIGFRDVHHHPIQVDAGYVSTDKYLERVRKKYISTLTLLSEQDFQRGFRIFERKIRQKYGSRIRYVSWFVFIAGQK